MPDQTALVTVLAFAESAHRQPVKTLVLKDTREE
jgi:hypothetical protein